MLPTRQGYDRWAEVYDCDGNPLIAMAVPNPPKTRPIAAKPAETEIDIP